MSNSYRIRTQVGVNKRINVQLEQDFDYLEILSLKLLPNLIYQRKCSDYGVIVGRVTANNGFGVPNVKVSVFTPLTDQDSLNPVISDLYPYKSISDLNEDGYRYNLLPKTQSHSGHVPVGTFFSKEDVLTNPSIIEVFDKYYRYTALTNDSGDFMIFGVPVGDQLVHIDVDLSDIGEFSLAPQDLIRMGIATESQIAGNKFRQSTNLNELVQLVSFNRNLYVAPLWGEPEICNLSINRLDFDLTAESNINITPTAIFMGSIFSSTDDQFQKRNCKPKIAQGELCSLVAGPGQILAIRQTANLDDLGRPILEQYDLEQGGQVIDDNGTWLVDLPMNLDYVSTNEFGERIVSNDPKIGIPTRAKYRFKIKWNQSPKLSEPIKRAYFLVPNVREYGWNNGDNDPLQTNAGDRELALKSYAFSLDWEDYADIQAAIDCEDSFYPFLYNKVYTVSQLIDQYRNGYLPNRIIAVRNILDQTCESTNVKFPTNDAVYRFDLIYLLFSILIFILKPLLYLFLWVAHLIAAVLKWLEWLLGPVWKRIANLQIPNLSYPDCDLCECKIGRTATGSGPSAITEALAENATENAIISPLTQYTAYDQTENYALLTLFSGKPIDPNYPNLGEFLAPNSGEFDERTKVGTTGLPIAEKINLFNVKAKYFNNSTLSNPGSGGNRIKVTFDPTLNPSNFHYDNTLTFLVKPDFKSRLSAGTIISFQDPALSTDINVTGYTTTNQFNTFSTTGTSINNGNRTNNTPAQITVSYAHIAGDGTNRTVNYNIYQNPSDANYYKFAADIEYFQVVTAITYNQYETMVCSPNSPSYLRANLNYRFINYAIKVWKWIKLDTQVAPPNLGGDHWFSTPWKEFTDYDKQIVVIMVRGVDPYSSRMPIKYGLGRLFGYTNEDQISVTINGKLNIPIQASGIFVSDLNNSTSFAAVRHDELISDVTDIDTLGLRMYYNSYHFVPNNNPTTNFRFIPFQSNLPNYYSAVSKLNIGADFFDGNGPQKYARLRNDLVLNREANCGAFTLIFDKVLGLKNSFLIDLDYICGSLATNDARLGYKKEEFFVQTTAWNGKSNYQQYEIIDGGSGMSLDLELKQQLGTSPYNGEQTWRAYTLAPKYDLTIPYSYNNIGTTGKIVMRSDRLPTSTNTLIQGGNSYPLQLNVGLQLYTIFDNGTSEATGGVNVGSPNFNAGSSENNPAGLAVLDTFTCSNLVPLECYYANAQGEIDVRNKTPNPDSCYTNQYDGQLIMENGCYVFITAPGDSIGRDTFLLTEWISRLQIVFGACRNVWSHIFTNNWINGSLYAFSFKNDRFFTSPFTQPLTEANKPYSEYCKDTIVLHPTNNFYYRSSPYYTGSTINPIGRFVGSKAPKPPEFIALFLGNSYNGNDYNLKTPTTIMDMGPRSQYIQELVFSDAYDGFIMNRLSDTTYKDVSELLNFLIISRLANTKFIERLFSVNGANIMTFFDRRSRNFVDADYSQMLSISSEIGVNELESINYPPIDNRQDPIYLSNASSDEVVIGVFFSSDTQTRDFITPKRTIINPNLSIGVQCAFNYYDNFSQYVPFYQWEIIENSGNDNIFGSQSNDWYTSTLSLTGLTPTQDINSPVNTFFYHRYQSLDRIESNSRYYRPANTSYSKDFKGYIYNVDYTSIGTPPTNSTSIFDFEYEPDWTPTPNPANQEPIRVFTVGAPFHFYFGLKKGKTAFDRFAKKWLDLETFTD